VLGEVEPPCRRSGRQACAHSAAVCHVHPSGLVPRLDHIADEDRIGPACQTRLVRGRDEPAEPLHAVAKVVAPASVLARGCSLDTDAPGASGFLPPAFYSRLSRARPPGATPAALPYLMRRRLSSINASHAPPGCRPRHPGALGRRRKHDAGRGARGADHCALLPLRGDERAAHRKGGNTPRAPCASWKRRAPEVGSPVRGAPGMAVYGPAIPWSSGNGCLWWRPRQAPTRPRTLRRSALTWSLHIRTIRHGSLSLICAVRRPRRDRALPAW